MIYLYTLAQGIPRPCSNTIVWARWFSTADRVVGRTTIGDIDVSTVFLGVDQDYGMTGEPILFETMCFFDGGTVWCCRCGGTLVDAEAMHRITCDKVRRGEILPWGESAAA